MMISKIKQLLNQLKVTDVIVTENNPIFSELTIQYPTTEIVDARSAAFEALGRSKDPHNLIAIFVDENYLSNLYTGITEAWFQRINIIIFTYNANLYSSIEYFDRCILSKDILIDSSDLKEVESNILLENGPHLVRTSLNIASELTIDYSAILNIIPSIFKVNCYNPKDTKENAITPKFKYGVLSKYIGNILVSKDPMVLCVPEHLLAYDTNIYNFRDIPQSFRLIVMADTSGYMHRLNDWIAANGIKIITISKSEVADLDINSEKSIYYIK